MLTHTHTWLNRTSCSKTLLHSLEHTSTHLETGKTAVSVELSVYSLELSGCYDGSIYYSVSNNVERKLCVSHTRSCLSMKRKWVCSPGLGITLMTLCTALCALTFDLHTSSERQPDTQTETYAWTNLHTHTHSRTNALTYPHAQILPSPSPGPLFEPLEDSGPLPTYFGIRQ